MTTDATTAQDKTTTAKPLRFRLGEAEAFLSSDGELCFWIRGVGVIIGAFEHLFAKYGRGDAFRPKVKLSAEDAAYLRNKPNVFGMYEL